VPPPVPCLVRVEDMSATAIGRALDAGAEGIIVPLVETAEQARAAVSACHYPPKGTRSGGGVRPLADFVAYRQAADEAVAVGVMIETAEGLANAGAIAAVEDVDLVFIGTGDLALSLGTFPKPERRHEDAVQAVLAACRYAEKPCGVFTGGAEAAAKRRRQGFAMTVVANDIDAVQAALRAAQLAYKTGARAGAPGGGQGMSGDLLAQFADAISTGAIRVIDLTQTLRPSTPVIQLPPDFAPTKPFEISEISRYDSRGPAWYWNNIACGEHTGTHFDAPAHWVTGKNHGDGYTDTVSVQRMIAPAVVIDCSQEAAKDERFLLTPDHVRTFEEKHGQIPRGAWVLMRTDWSKRTDPAQFLNMKEDGPHVPGPNAEAVRFLAYERDVTGWGVEAVGTDAGQAFAFEPPFPAHALMHGANKFGLASLCNLDLLPPTGAVLITPPLKIERGSGSPLRVLALVER
jgi:kynurenine formamidase/2-keto-3-deoxy-L-rhamnonate aldolase RhmA